MDILMPAVFRQLLAMISGAQSDAVSDLVAQLKKPGCLSGF